VIKTLAGGYELDDDRARIDVEAVHRYISGESYWGRGRPRTLVTASLEGSMRLIGLYHDGAQVGFARVVGDGALMAYLADVYVLAAHRGRGLGVALVRFTVDEIGLGDLYWALHTADAQGLYAKLGFCPGPIGHSLMERARQSR
jgi:GNAT superfamily N-acetyltransferase